MNFTDFFKEIHGHIPFPWQTELAAKACVGGWPEYLAVPTGCGKTAAIDAAVFALAANPSANARRIFYTVNRRIIVDEAYDRACKIAAALANPRNDQPNVKAVAEKLRTLGANDNPLECVQLRGGVWRDNDWYHSATQPMIVCSTVDQVGSRLLFRGYGVSESSYPIHTALVANDSLLLLDEAHISHPFAQTLTAIKRYRASALCDSHIATPFIFVQMTATPPSGADTMRLSETDHKNKIISARISASKPAALVTAPKNKLVDTLIGKAKNILKENCPRSIAILVNRVATARAVSAKLPGSTLVIGRMRPFDRDDIARSLSAELKTGCAGTSGRQSPLVVISTQCLEVGADLDFDALVTECASLDSLRQRFGRLNRDGRPIDVHAAIVFDGATTEDDPIYGAALGQTWKWLNANATDSKGAKSIDFGIHVLDELLRSSPEGVFAHAPDAPVLLPAHLDALCQTSPEPAVQPDVSLFLHGPQPFDADIQLCWRSDLGDDTTRWPNILSLAPPSTLECLALRISEFRKWRDVNPQTPAIIWRGPEESTTDLTSLHPGATIVLPSSALHSEFWHIPKDAVPDQAGRALLTRKRQILLRIPPASLVAQFTWPPFTQKLVAFAKSPDNDIPSKELPSILHQAAQEESPLSETLAPWAAAKLRILNLSRYPGESGLVILASTDDPTGHRVDAPASVTLAAHHDAAQNAVREAVSHLPALIPFANDLTVAAAHHDDDKADERFQAMLCGGSLELAWAQPEPLAKSDRLFSLSAWEKAGLPRNFRHEAVSAGVQCVSDLSAHLIESHHGYGRPFFPPCAELAPAANIAAAERFWALTRQYGWWGLAYLETILRLADWQASANPEQIS